MGKMYIWSFGQNWQTQSSPDNPTIQCGTTTGIEDRVTYRSTQQQYRVRCLDNTVITSTANYGYEITYKCANGYVFDKASLLLLYEIADTATYSGSFTPGNTTTFNFSDGNTKLTLLLPNITDLTSFGVSSEETANWLGTDSKYAHIVMNCDIKEGQPAIYRTVTQELTNCTSDYSHTEVEDGEQITINLTPDSGYAFTTTPTYSMNGGTFNFTQTSTGYTAQITVSGDIVVNAVASVIGGRYSIEQNLTHCISDYSQTEVEDGEQITINLTPDSGYAFTTTPTYSMNGGTFNFTQTSTGYTAQITVSGDIVVNAVASVIIVYHSITQNLTHCISDYSQTEVEDGEQITINLTPDSGYAFTTTPTYSMGGNTFDFTQTPTGYTAQITVSGDIVVNAVASVIIVYNEIEQNLINCTSSFTGDRLVYGQEYTITLTVNSGFYFATFPTYRDEYGVVLPMNLNSDRTIATCTFTSHSKQVINGAGALIPTQKKYEFIGVYNPTSTELKQISAKRFVSYGSIKDLQDYVISLKKLYCNVDSFGKESVYLGEYSTDVSCNVLSGDFFEFELGDVTITEYYSNSNDYANTSIKGYLPFIGFVDLPVTQFMNETVSLIYRVNPITGDCMAIYRNEQGNDLQAFSGMICFDIPIRQSERSSIQLSSVNDNVWYLMNNLTPYIEVETNIEYQPANDLFGHEDNRQGLISSFVGYCRFSNIDLSMGEMTQDEYNEIINILQSGVII